jgi:hypothetical protein
MELFIRLLVQNKDNSFFHQFYAFSNLICRDLRWSLSAFPGNFLQETELAREEVNHLAIEALVFFAFFKHFYNNDNLLKQGDDINWDSLSDICI